MQAPLNQYTGALRKAALARKASTEGGVATEVASSEPEPTRMRSKRGRKAVVPERGSQGDAG